MVTIVYEFFPTRVLFLKVRDSTIKTTRQKTGFRYCQPGSYPSDGTLHRPQPVFTIHTVGSAHYPVYRCSMGPGVPRFNPTCPDRRNYPTTYPVDTTRNPFSEYDIIDFTVFAVHWNKPFHGHKMRSHRSLRNGTSLSHSCGLWQTMQSRQCIGMKWRYNATAYGQIIPRELSNGR